MAVHHVSKQRPQLEALERRETPSAGLGGVVHAAHLPIHPAIHRPLPFQGTGVATVVSARPVANGGFQTTSDISGQATQLGKYHGQVISTVSANAKSITGTAELTGAGGEQLDFNFAGRAGRPSKAITFRGNFVITGGTGHFLHATGGGTLNGSLNGTAGTVALRFNGRIVV